MAECYHPDISLSPNLLCSAGGLDRRSQMMTTLMMLRRLLLQHQPRLQMRYAFAYSFSTASFGKQSLQCSIVTVSLSLPSSRMLHIASKFSLQETAGSSSSQSDCLPMYLFILNDQVLPPQHMAFTLITMLCWIARWTGAVR